MVASGLLAAGGCSSADKVLVSDGGDPPQADAGMATVDGALPSEDGALPSEDGAVPSEDGAVPSEDGAVPSEDGAVPSEDGAVPLLDGSAALDSARPSVDGAAWPDGDGAASETVLDLDALKTTPLAYAWFDFKPNVKKLILAGAAETQHIAVLWYTISEGGVGLHYHAKTESVYVIDGTQTDSKGVYSTGALYFNPPGSGHEITHSSGFFLLAYAAPPDFAKTDLIGEYSPIRVDTTATDLTQQYAFVQAAAGMSAYELPLDATGGLSAKLIESTALESYVYQGNYVLVLNGTCLIQGMAHPKNTLVVGTALAPHPFQIAASEGATCLAMGISF
jgi:hypothetical protein